MQEPRELVIQIRQEEKELNEKLTRLEYFMMTEDYQRISDRQKLLLKDQHEAMSTYKRILIARAIQINFEEKDKEEPEYPLCPRETDTNCCFKKAGKCTAPMTHCYKSAAAEAENPKKYSADPEEKEERLEPHVFAAMEYEAHRQKKQDAEERRCCKCKHGQAVHGAPGVVRYECSSPKKCKDHSEWEAY